MTSRPINVGLSPNTQPDDIELAKDLLRKPENWVEGPNVAELEL